MFLCCGNLLYDFNQSLLLFPLSQEYNPISLIGLTVMANKSHFSSAGLQIHE